MSENSQILDELRYIRSRVDQLATNGCARAAQHDDHENRVREVERVLSRASGAMAAIIAISGLIGAVAGWATSFFKGDQ